MPLRALIVIVQRLIPQLQHHVMFGKLLVLVAKKHQAMTTHALVHPAKHRRTSTPLFLPWEMLSVVALLLTMRMPWVGGTQLAHRIHRERAKCPLCRPGSTSPMAPIVEPCSLKNLEPSGTCFEWHVLRSRVFERPQQVRQVDVAH
jgi:hypothetical protein